MNDFVTASGQSVPVEIRRRKGTRHFKLTLGFQNQVLASAPWHASARNVLKFVEKQRGWIEAQLAEAPKVLTLTDWLEGSPQVTASGDVIAVRIFENANGRSRYTFAEGGAMLVLELPERDEASLVKLVRTFAKDALTCRTYYHSKRLGLSFDTLSVRDQSSRWGSCSTLRGISLNWRLILLSPQLQDYVILHELAHLSEMNHGARFWALLDAYDPNRMQNERVLSEMSAQIMRIGR